MRSNNAARAAFRAFVKLGTANSDQVLRKIALDLLVAIVKRSPVDTGRFRGNWAVQVSLAPQISDAEDKSGASTIAKGASELGRFRVGDALYLLNHLPYSIELENGHSGQAPAGMVKITAQEFAQYVNRAAGGLRT